MMKDCLCQMKIINLLLEKYNMKVWMDKYAEKWLSTKEGKYY